MKTTFKIGDLVELKSGGPTMTVQKRVEPSFGIPGDDDGHVRCQWFSGKKLESGNFPPGSLKQVTPKGE